MIEQLFYYKDGKYIPINTELNQGTTYMINLKITDTLGFGFEGRQNFYILKSGLFCKQLNVNFYTKKQVEEKHREKYLDTCADIIYRSLAQ